MLNKNNLNQNKGCQQFKVIGYFTNWGIYGRNYQVYDIPAQHLTHIHYAFLKVNPNNFKIELTDSYADIEKRFTQENNQNFQSYYGMIPCDTWNDQENQKQNISYFGNFRKLNQLRDLKMQKSCQKLNLIASIGGWSLSGPYPELIKCEKNMKNFSLSCMQFLQKFSFDGIDLDFEFICFGPQGSYQSAKPEEADQFINLLKILRQDLDKLQNKMQQEYSLSVAVNSDTEKLKYLKINKIQEFVDYIAFMTYDFAGSWDKKTGHQSPLFINKNASQLTIQNVVNFCEKNNVNKKKIIIGSPMYGRSWKTDKSVYQDSQGIGIGQYEQGVIDYNLIKGQCQIQDYQNLNNYFKKNQVRANIYW